MNKWTAEERGKLLPFLKLKLQDSYSTQDIRWAIEHHRCAVNGQVERYCSTRLSPNDQILFAPIKKPLFVFEPSRVLFEDEAIMAYDKPAGIDSAQLATLLNTRLVHRLDRDTTGVILFAKHEAMQDKLETLFRDRLIEKHYVALVYGTPPKQGIINKPMRLIRRIEGRVTWGIGRGKTAKTEWKKLHQYKKTALLHCTPHTGRTHQIRVHLQSIGHSIVGDIDYGPREQTGDFRPLLHAESIEFIHPISEEKLTIEAPLAADFRERLTR